MPKNQTRSVGPPIEPSLVVSFPHEIIQNWTSTKHRLILLKEVLQNRESIRLEDNQAS